MEADSIAERVYDVLVKEAGATDDESNRLQFKFFWRRHGDEFRFMGTLGFGGKLHVTRRVPRLRVDCYPEDLTPERAETIERTNRVLAELSDELAEVGRG